MDSILELYDHDERIARDWPPMVRDASTAVVRHLPRPGFARNNGFITWTDLDAETVDAVIGEQADLFRERRLGIGWKVYGHDQPADLGDRLVAHGFAADDPESIMVLDLGAIPADLASAQTRDIRPIREPADLMHAQAIARAVWNDEMLDLFAELAYLLEHHPDRLSVYVAWEDEKPVSAAWLQMPPTGRFASLWGGSTLADYRGRGLYTALLAMRVREAAARGYRFITVDAGPMSRPIVERFGFAELTSARDYNLPS